jgi:hypothetical protein
MKTKNNEVYVNYRPHPAQNKFHSSEARFKVCCTGRRWGKTLAATMEILKDALANPGCLNWWVAPVYGQTMVAYRMLSKGRKVIANDLRSLKRIELIQGSAIEFKSADNFDSLRGSGIHLLVIDEAALIDREAWEEALRPTLTDTKGKAIFVSTPKGRNYFFELFCRGQDPQYPEWESFTFPTSSNPYILPEEIEEAKKTLPDTVFKQEYLAEFLEDSAGVFRNIKACIRGSFEEPQENHSYVIGWDPAKHTDFSVVTVFDSTKNSVVAFDRFNQIDYTFQVTRVCNLAWKYKAPILMDSTGVGDPLLEQIKRMGVAVEGYEFTATSKQQLVEHLSVQIEQEAISFPPIKEIIHELEIFQYEITRAGNIRYSAPQGYHDDCVMSLALAVWKARRTNTPTIWRLK